MIIVGIIGAENDHALAMAKTMNGGKQVKGFRVDYIWGETLSAAKKVAKEGGIANVVSKTEDMMGKIDALIVDHRHGKFHLAPAVPYVKAGIPCFIDKPFCYRSSEGKVFLALAQKHGTPVTSFSVLPYQASFHAFKKKVDQASWSVGSFYGPGYMVKKWGGIFFYGIHQVEPMLRIFGFNVESVMAVKNGKCYIIECLYSQGRMVSINLIDGFGGGFHASALTDNGIITAPLTFDKDMFLPGIKAFCKMFKTGHEPEEYANIIKSVQVLEAMEKSIESGNRVRVAK